MIELVVDDEVIEVPEELTLGIYQSIQMNKEFIDENPKHLISLFTGLPFPVVKDMTVDQVQLVELFLSTKMDLPEDIKLTTKFTYKGVEYGLENDWSKLAWGAWVDMEVYSSGDIYENLHRIMAILYRPIISKDKKSYKIAPYKSEEIEERAEIMKQVPVTYWIGVAQFFFLIVKGYIENMQDSLERTNKMNKWMEKGWKILPKFIQKKLQLDSILISPINSPKKTSPKWRKSKK